MKKVLVPVVLIVLVIPTASIFAACTELTKAQEHSNAGVCLYDQGNYEEAITEYNEAIWLDPNMTIAYDNRGWVYYETGQYDLAIADYYKAIDLNPNDALFYTNRAIAYDMNGQETEAQQDIDRAVALGWDRAALEQCSLFNSNVYTCVSDAKFGG
ncbi:tetratricopeptide repeat protein, partial [Chloroflexota bacterium]